jgi:putative FmdB family regulatory protein
MPLYEYQCKKCKHRFEKIQQFSDEPIKKCPECGGQVEKLLSASSVRFKGSGWYVTDYPKKGAAAHAASSEGDAGSKDAKGTKEMKESKKDDKHKADSSHKKHKKD